MSRPPLGNARSARTRNAGAVIGVAFQNQQDSQNIGYVIPVPTIAHFLADVEASDPKKCRGFCSLGIFWQALENRQQRKVLHMGDERSGVLIRGVLPVASAANHLRRDDVLLALDGKPIANDGSFAVHWHHDDFATTDENAKTHKNPRERGTTTTSLEKYNDPIRVKVKVP